jgi:DHA1 family bicyclomycin/chloramphenicol resistance-like MFS transporter
MSRAIVRDLFEHEQSARIMNMIGIILAVGPAAAPTIGGVTMELAGWHAIFLVMAVAGIGIALAAIFLLRETVERDLSRIRPRQLLRNYVLLVSTPYFMTASLMNAGATGALYALATILPFVLMGPIALTPTQFGASMTIQSFSYLFGSLALRFLMPRFGAFRLVPVGLVVMACGATAMALVPHIFEPGFLLVMAPVGVYAFGIAFITAAMTTAAMAPFPRNAGSAAAMIGFMQMGAGLLGGTVAALIGDPVLAFTTVVPCLALMSIVSWLIWRRLPAPEMATPVSQPVVLE